MPPSQRAHARTRSLLQLQKLLDLRDGASPLTLIIDSLEQPAGLLGAELAARAKTSAAQTIFLSFATLRKPVGYELLINAAGKTPDAIRIALRAAVATGAATTASAGAPTTPAVPPPKPRGRGTRTRKTLVLLDSLNEMLATLTEPVATFLPSLVAELPPGSSLAAVYHADVPLARASTPCLANEYAPEPLTLMAHLATAVIRVESLARELARRRARDRGGRLDLETERGEGMLISGRVAGPSGEERRGLILDVELRRRSGRCVGDRFVLVRSAGDGGGSGGSRVGLLADYGLGTGGGGGSGCDAEGGEEGGPESTFDLGLTEKQRRDRDGVALPYMDAQAGGEGGRILYDMGREDDFDEEDDEE